jgi:uncharacterized protein YoxC
MPPRPQKEKEKEPESLEDAIKLLKNLTTQFANFGAKLTPVDTMSKQLTSVEERLTSMEAKLNDAIAENKQLKKEIAKKDTTIEELKSSYTGLEENLNKLEQYNRAWSVRILNVPLTSEEEASSLLVRDKVYDLVFLPILQGALGEGAIRCIPDADELLEAAHVLPGKPGENKPIIARFYNRYLRSVCLRLKKAYATKTAKTSSRPPAGGQGMPAVMGARAVDGVGRDERGWVTFPFFEDLTAHNFKKMRAIAQDSRVLSCWSVNGQLRFRLNDSTVIKRVSSVFESIDKIVTK